MYNSLWTKTLHSSQLQCSWQLLSLCRPVHPAVRQTGRKNRWGVGGGYGPRQMNSHLDWRWPLCASQRCCCSDTSLLHSNVWSEEKGTGGSDHHSAQLPCHCLPTLTPNINWTESDLTLNTSQLSVGWEESKLWGGGERYCRWLGGVWVKDRTGQFTC